MNIPRTTADLTPWLERGWRELDPRSAEGKAAAKQIGCIEKHALKQHARSFRRGRRPILVGTAQMAEDVRAMKQRREPEVYRLGSDEPSYLLPRGRSLIIIERL